MPSKLAQQQIVGLTIAKWFGNIAAMNKNAVHHIIDTLTADAIMAELGVSFHMIRYARTTGMFPASWYGPIRVMADDVGIACPLSAFNWKSSANTVSRGMGKNQGSTEKGVA